MHDREERIERDDVRDPLFAKIYVERTHRHTAFLLLGRRLCAPSIVPADGSVRTDDEGAVAAESLASFGRELVPNAPRAFHTRHPALGDG
jgi:hypothetical protein